MTPEYALARFTTQLKAGDIPPATHRTLQRMLLACIGAGIAGADEDGIAALRALLVERGGRGEARTLVYGDAVPAVAAAQLNGTLCRALDYCDAMAPGVHFGSAVVPAGFAAAELAGGCTGVEFLAALVAGCEVGSRFNLTEAMYDGFDPTGIAAVFAATATAARILHLTEQQTLNALGLAFNRCCGSFQSNVDGSLAVRVIQGWVAQAGLECAQLAQAGINGPPNFLTGVYGYAHLYGRDELDPHAVVASLGNEWRMNRMVFKKFPSCGATQALTELVLQSTEELGLTAERVAGISIRLTPYCHKLVGHEYRSGDSPRVNAQFSAQFCAANALVRRSSKLEHFKLENLGDSRVLATIRRIHCLSEAALDARGHTATDVVVATTDGGQHLRQLDVAPGFPGNELTDAQHRARFADCMAYAPHPLTQEQVARFLDAVARLDELPDARQLLDHLIVVAPQAPVRVNRPAGVLNA